LPAEETLHEGVDRVGVREFQGGRELALGGEDLGAEEVHDGVTRLDDRSWVQRRGVSTDHAPGDARDNGVEGALVIARDAVRADEGGRGPLGNADEFEAHPLLLLAGEFPRLDGGHFHPADRAVAGSAADEVHHRAGVAGAGAGGRGGFRGGGEE
jgi:hypothetical protein